MAVRGVSRRRQAWKPTDRFHIAVCQKVTNLALTPLLAVGCNTGTPGRRLPASIQWCGVDIDPPRSARARRRAVCADAVALPFADNTFGAVTLLSMLNLVPNPEVALSEAHRVLRPDGLVAVGVVSLDDPPEVQALVNRPVQSCTAMTVPALVKQYFTDVEILGRNQQWEAGTWGRVIDGRHLPTVPFATTRREALVFGRKT
jgi:SAM-dependent methyltransferase